MYVVYDESHNIIAFNEKEDVCAEYVSRVEQTDNISLEYSKLKKKSEYKLNGKDDLYLVGYGETYIQAGYVMYMDLVSDQIKYDNKYVANALKRILETSELEDKEYKILKKATKIIEDLSYDNECYTPSLEWLKGVKADYDPYIYNYKIGV